MTIRRAFSGGSFLSISSMAAFTAVCSAGRAHTTSFPGSVPASGNGEAKLAVSPRLTLLLPSGDRKRSLGAGGLGIQVSLPLSLVLSDRFVTHWNAGATFTPSATDASGETASLASWNAGQSVVWLAHPRFNLLLETVVNSVQAFSDGGGTERHTDVLVSPGARFAFNLPDDLQIVVGAAAPIGLGANHGQNSVFLYFSVELPFWHPAR